MKATNDGESALITYKHKEKECEERFEKALIAVGMTGQIDNIGLEEVGIETEGGFIRVTENCQTNIENIYAIGDVSGAPLLAHVASHEAVIAVSHLLGESTHQIDKGFIPACTYSYPQVASFGKTERELKEQGVEYKASKVPFMANGKALASNEKDGFIKVLLDNEQKLLGVHITGMLATELLPEFILMKGFDLKASEVGELMFAHPTLSEWLQEAINAALGKSLNI